MQIGVRLFGALAPEDPDVVVAATGASCRQQMAPRHARLARHPVELLREAVLRADAACWRPTAISGGRARAAG
jgi:Fe-S oxidoreductase